MSSYTASVVAASLAEDAAVPKIFCFFLPSGFTTEIILGVELAGVLLDDAVVATQVGGSRSWTC